MQFSFTHTVLAELVLPLLARLLEALEHFLWVETSEESKSEKSETLAVELDQIKPLGHYLVAALLCPCYGCQRIDVFFPRVSRSNSS